ncbi:MAG: F0F1 ATP synthase subunit B [Gemmatimonadaceae bacterium]
MRSVPLSALFLLGNAATAFAAEEGKAPDLLSPSGGLMFWTLLIFIALFLVLSKFAFGPITAAVEAREKALEEAIEGAKRDRAEAARLLADQRAAIEAARTEAQKLIADGRAAAERVRAELIEQAKGEQASILERARREIGAERDRAILELRREAVDLAIAGASKVVEQNLDNAGNRRLVESFLATVPAVKS